VSAADVVGAHVAGDGEPGLVRAKAIEREHPITDPCHRPVGPRGRRRAGLAAEHRGKQEQADRLHHPSHR